MRAVILVGGFGTRLRPLTLDTPKQMLPMVGVTMLERVVAKLASHGVDDVVLSLGYRPDVFSKAFPDGTCAGVPIHYAVEPEPLDTAGAIGFAANDAGIKDTFIAVNGDVLTDLDVTAQWAQHHATGAEGTIALTPVDDPSRFGVVPLDVDGRVEAFIEKPEPGTAPTNWINAGTYVLEHSVLDRIEPGRKVSIEREIFPVMASEKTLYGFHSDAYWIDAGTPEAYLQAQLDLIDGNRGPAEVAVHPTAEVDPTAVVERSVIGSGAVVGANCRITNSIVMAHAVLQPGCVIKDSIVGCSASVGEESNLTDLSVVGHSAEVPRGTKLEGSRLPSPQTWPSNDQAG